MRTAWRAQKAQELTADSESHDFNALSAFAFQLQNKRCARELGGEQVWRKSPWRPIRHGLLTSASNAKPFSLCVKHLAGFPHVLREEFDTVFFQRPR